MCHTRHRTHLPRARSSEPGHVRVSDADRERAVTLLGDHSAEGRLTAGELDERTAAALRASTRTDLDELFADLPAPAQSARGGRHTAEGTFGGDGVREHLLAFVAVNLLLVAIWAATGAGYFWPIWPLIGWGIGVVSHGSAGWRGAARGPRARGMAQ